MQKRVFKYKMLDTTDNKVLDRVTDKPMNTLEFLALLNRWNRIGVTMPVNHARFIYWTNEA